ncbi:MAG: biopolymer transporter ExbD [Rhodobiaceae bacterium]|nr:biopolymer transporter ExbD [Rhodobiaceae bacterium]MCC0047791.1 biopolymer transporter ExbD [Rhodobiaceae bacterium]
MRIEPAAQGGVFRRRLGLTPLIDVIFLLLLFFMLTSTFQRAGELAVSGGDAGTSAAGELPDLIVKIEAGGALALNGEHVDAPDVPDRLSTLHDGGAQRVAVSAGVEASVADLTLALDRLAQAGFEQVQVVRGAAVQ